jgi:hypothetical protein
VYELEKVVSQIRFKTLPAKGGISNSQITDIENSLEKEAMVI